MSDSVVYITIENSDLVLKYPIFQKTYICT